MLMSNNVEKSDLTKIIKKLRQEMIRTGLNKGLTNERTIQISKKLDEYIAKYQIFNK
jgi:hypothetical protein